MMDMSDESAKWGYVELCQSVDACVYVLRVKYTLTAH
jgi:hypothetical protein